VTADEVWEEDYLAHDDEYDRWLYLQGQRTMMARQAREAVRLIGVTFTVRP